MAEVKKGGNRSMAKALAAKVDKEGQSMEIFLRLKNDVLKRLLTWG